MQRNEEVSEPKDEELRKPKNIVVFSDGTSQEGGRGSNTNVYRLFNMLEDRTSRQITFYDQGVGSERKGVLAQIAGKIAGRGFKKNMLECYQFIFDHYESRDRVYLFGFSRGAATVRSLSGFIDLFGILPKSRPDLIRDAYDIYEKRDREKRAADFVLRNHTMSCRIKFLGVWDTVVALGLPFRLADIVLSAVWQHDFHDFTLSKRVEHACQAMAIDDDRKTFHPVVWRQTARAEQTMKQVWFCGKHSDVGGGGELADIPLAWMAAEATQQGLLIWPHHKVQDVTCNPDGRMGGSGGGLMGRLWRRQERSWDTALGPPTVHESVKERKLNRHNQAVPEYDPWILREEHEVEPWPPNQRGTFRIT